MNEIVKSVSIDNMVNQREAVVILVRQAHALLMQASELANAAHLGSLRGMFRARCRCYRRDLDFLGSDGPDEVMKELDGGGWAYLMNESGMRTFMDAAAREKWDAAMVNGDYPPLTRETIAATFKQLHEARGDLFERGVLEVFRRLSWDYKTNQPFKFGKRVILRGILSVYGNGRNYHAHINHRACDELDDLVRVFSVLDGKPEPDHRTGMYRQLSEQRRGGNSEWTGDYFALRWFKKGTGHLTFRRLDLVDKMNLILAKHYPNALASDMR
jgi:hypothetical protein